MQFLAPFFSGPTAVGFLAAGAFASIPIAVHFFFRSRYRTVPWAAMKFLLTSIEQTSRRLKFQELLLLLVRIAVLVLLALALQRLAVAYLGGSGSGGDAVDAVFVFDVSYSMTAADGPMSRLDRARDTALKILDRLPPHSTVQIVTCSDRTDPEPLGPRNPANLDQARHLLKDIKPTSLASDLEPGIDLALRTLARGQATNKELYVFSDMQRSAWEKQAGAVVRSLKDAREKVGLFLVRCGTRPLANAAIVGLTPQSGVPRPGQRTGFGILVRNSGSEPTGDLTVTLETPETKDAPESMALPPLAPGETRAVTLSAKLEKPGLTVLTARLSHDDLPGDNRFDQVVLVRDQIRVLVVDGSLNARDPEKSSSYFLVHALQPVEERLRGKYHLQPVVRSPRLATAGELAQADLCILSDVALRPNPKKPAEIPPPDFLPALENFVKSGKSLIVFAGDNVAPAHYNDILGKKHGLLPLPITDLLVREAKNPLPIDRASAALPAFWKFKDDEYYKGVGNLEVWKTLILDDSALRKTEEAEKEAAPEKADAAADAEEAKDKKPARKEAPVAVALRYSDGKPAVVLGRVGTGEVLLFATAATPGIEPDTFALTWTNLPLHPVFLPLMDVTLSRLLQGQTQDNNVVAGRTWTWRPAEKRLLSYSLYRPDGEEVRLGLPRRVDDRQEILAEDLPDAGIWKLVGRSLSAEGTSPPPDPKAGLPDAAAGVPLAVTPDLAESEDIDTLPNEEIDRRLGFRPVHLTAGSAASGEIAEVLERESDWPSRWLLVAVLGLLLVETALALWCGRGW